MLTEPAFFPEVDTGEIVKRIEASLEEFSGLFFLDFFLSNDGRLTLSISYPDVVHLIGVLLTLANRMRTIHRHDDNQTEATEKPPMEQASIVLADKNGPDLDRLSRYLRLAMLIYSRLRVEGDGDDKQVFEICLTNASRLAGNGQETTLCD